MSAHSSLDSLLRLSPVSDHGAAAVFGVAGREELLADLTRLPFGRLRLERTAPRRRRRALVLAFALVTLAVTATAAWAVFGSSAHETTSVECVIGGTDTVIPSTSGDPAADCAAQWQHDLGTTPPPLAAFDNGHGGITVIPRSDKPQAGWIPLPGHSQDVALIQLQESLDDYIAGLNAGCLDGTAATALARTKLARFGFTGWTVTLRSAQGPGLCTNADIVDPTTRTVTLIPTGAATGPQMAFEKLAARLRPLTRTCESRPDAVASVRAAAQGLTYELNAVTDNSLRCASIYETVGGTIFLTVRGPNR